MESSQENTTQTTEFTTAQKVEKLSEELTKAIAASKLSVVVIVGILDVIKTDFIISMLEENKFDAQF